jgi:hypothetical protein
MSPTMMSGKLPQNRRAEKRQTNLGLAEPFEVLALGYRARLGSR